MPQETNLNVAPYFDDFDPQSNYYKVLFKPGFPVQARELTGLQSILQNQIESFGNNIFKEGAKVIPGDLTYIQNFYGVQIETEFLGIPVGIYLDQLIGTTITGATSGITAKVVSYITDEESERGVYTLYLNYENSPTSDEGIISFLDNEVLLTGKNITYASTFISSGEGFATTIPSNSAIIGSSFNISQGVYYLRGYFVNVDEQTLILDQYSNTPSYRVGLDVVEEIISSDDDPSLNDNARGFNNFTAPGADRLKISTTLSKKPLGSFDESNFVQLSEVKDGILRLINKNTEFNFLGDEFARRTFDESGNYYVKEFVTSVKNSLNDNEGNRGIYNSNQTTQSGNVPSDDIGIYKISPGKAYVKGYEVETIATSLIDFQKPRSTRSVEDQAVNFGFGPTLNLNRVSGSAQIGVNTTLTLSLRDQRIGSDSLSSAGKEIGIARVYDFALESGSYDTNFPNLNVWDLSLFDVQTYTDITLNEPVTLNTSTFIKGESSGAKGYLKSNVSAGTAITAYNVEGEFFKGERIIFNGVLDDARFIVSDKNYKLSDVKSVFTNVGSSKTFTGDTIQSKVRSFGSANVSAEDSGSSLISIPVDPGFSFIGIVSTGNLVRYSRPDLDTASFARVTGVGRTNITVQAVTTVSGICDGTLPSSSETVSNLELLSTKGSSSFDSGNSSSNNAIFSELPKQNISSVDLLGSELVIRKQFNTSITNNSTPIINAGSNEVFLPFDEERYTLIRSDGSTEVLTDDRFDFTNGSQSLQINGLGSNDTDTQLITTIRKTNVTSKTKLRNISKDLIINKSSNSASGIGTTTLNDGLNYGNFPFGTRVQDEIISLNTVDVYKIYGIFESENNEDPTSPFMKLLQLDGISGTTNDLIIGETLVGQTSGAKAVYLRKLDDTSIYFTYLNQSTFKNGEVINFKESSVNCISSEVKLGSKEITTDFKFFNGQKNTFYDYSRLIRRGEAQIPARKLRVYYASSTYDSGDTGDITTVNSYIGYDYGKEIPLTGNVRNSDIIDARPRLSDYSVVEGAKSPFEFDGRVFADGANGNLQSSKNVIASDESLTVNYEYYLPRADRIYIDREGSLGVSYGTPDDQPRLPDSLSNVMNIANVYLPAYLYNVSDAEVKFIENKRYQMSDIAKLEQRIKNLEYYTSLNQLETNTLNLFVEDANGNNRFKSGIFVDNFTTLETQDTSIGIRNSVDTERGILRPSHYTTAINLELGTTAISGIGTTSNTNQDSNFAEVVGVNVKKTDRILTLGYTDNVWLEQPYATRVENVTPFLVQFWQGNIELTPEVDIWIDVNELEVNDVLLEGSFRGVAEALGADITTRADGTRSGISPVVWNSWETVGVNVNTSLSNNQSTETNSTNRQTGSNTQSSNGLTVTTQTFQTETTTTTTNTINATTSTSLAQNRTGQQFFVNERIDTESLGNRVVKREIINFMRSRNIDVNGTGFKPFTRLYSFFDDVDVNNYVSPKLIEIEMLHGTFIVGETVRGRMNDGGSEIINSSTVPTIDFRVANTNHKYGPYNNPSDVYDTNPYDREITIPPIYSESSTILNIDTFSLQSLELSQFSGWISTSMILTGTSSGAEAKVTNVRLISDRVGTLQCSYFVPSPSNPANPTFETGRTNFRLTSSSTNSLVEGIVSSAGETIFYSQGDLDTTQESTLSLRNATVQTTDTSQTRTLSDSSTASTVLVSSDINTDTTTTSEIDLVLPPPPPPQVIVLPPPVIIAPPPVPPQDPPNGGGQTDPLAQTFIVDDPTGVFITKVDIFFQSKDANVPVLFEIRETNLGTPTQKVLPFSFVSVNPDNVNTSLNGTVPTTINLKAPVYLNPGREYAIVLLSKSTEYKVWISRLGEPDVTTLGQEAGQILVTEQPLLGSLFKSQNASVWTPSQFEDLKFTLYAAVFESQGSVSFYNPDLPSDLSLIDPNGLTINSREIRVGLGTTVVDSGLIVGNTVKQLNGRAEGSLVAFAGSITSDLTITNAGVGYTPSSGGFTYTGIALTSITGKGINATADLTIQDGVAVGATIRTGGSGYVVGDVLTPVSIGSVNLGSGIQLSVETILGNNTLILDNVQGNFVVNNSLLPLYYENSSGITTELNKGVGGNVIPNVINVAEQGNYVRVFQRNHGLYSNINRVTISGVRGDTVTTTLSQDYNFDSTTFIPTNDIPTHFDTFENIGVAGTNPGYVKIGDEIIEYTGIDGNALVGITRGVDNTVIQNHAKDELIAKYELNGVSLRRINTSHNLFDVNSSELPEPQIGLDYYYIKLQLDANGVDRTPGNPSGFTALYFNENKIAGGPSVRGTYNLPFNLITPKVTTITPLGTNIISQARTISAASVSGNQESYLDKGFKQTTLYDKNYFDGLRMIASPENENIQLDAGTFPGKKSFSLNFTLLSSNSRISPVIDLDNASVVFTMNRVNRPVTNYISNFRVNTTEDDPNRFVYVSKNVTLENPATSLEVLLDGYISNFNDIRVFYALNQDVPVEETIFTAFPGYNNIDTNGSIIDISQNDGTSDKRVPTVDSYVPEPTSDQFREYKFTIDDVVTFKSFRVKIIATSTDQSNAPQIRNLRVISFA